MIAPSLLAAAAAVAIIELDAASAAQLMVCRPAVFGPILGAAFGQLALGTGLGALWELLSLDAPIGGHLPINATAAAGACLLMALGDGGVAPEAAFPFGVLAGWLHRSLESSLRDRRAACAARCERRLALGEAPGFGRTAALELAKQAAMTFGILVAALMFRSSLAAAWPGAPESVRGALSFGLSMSPWIGVAALAHALRVAA